MNLKGTPSVLHQGSISGREFAAQLIAPDFPTISLHAMVWSALSALDEAATVVVDPYGRKLYVTDDSFDAALLAGAVSGASTKRVELRPDADQVGSSLTWSPTTVGAVEIGGKVSGVVATRKPARTVSSLVAAAIQSTSDAQATRRVIVIVDQTNAVVKFHELTDAELLTAQASLDSLDLAGGSGMVISVPLPVVETESPLVFEGGPTPDVAPSAGFADESGNTVTDEAGNPILPEV